MSNSDLSDYKVNYLETWDELKAVYDKLSIGEGRLIVAYNTLTSILTRSDSSVISSGYALRINASSIDFFIITSGGRYFYSGRITNDEVANAFKTISTSL